MSEPVFEDRALFVPATDTLVLSDLHLGRDATANVELPLGESGRLQDRIETLLDTFRPATVVFAGDLLHAFDTLPSGVTAQFRAIEDAVVDAGAEPVFVRGNHDTLLDTLTGDELQDGYWVTDEMYVCHGHEQPSVDASRYVIGHEHPALTVAGKRRPCYLVGPQTDTNRNAARDSHTKPGTAGTSTRDQDMVVLPAFNRLAPGVDLSGVRTVNLQSPVIGRLEAYRPGVVDEEAGDILWFPPLGQLRGHL